MSAAVVVKERPILFSGPMVRALLSGAKTQTRRIIKGVEPVENIRLHDGFLQAFIGDLIELPESDPDAWHMVHTDWERGYHCPYGRPGDRLWVRECFRQWIDLDDPERRLVTEYAADNPPHLLMDDGDGYTVENKDGTERSFPFKPSIHMPRKLCRIILEITDVRVERLADISEEDAKAEGIEAWAGTLSDQPRYSLLSHPKNAFRMLWVSINGPNSWDANPWIWALTFKRVTL